MENRNRVYLVIGVLFVVYAALRVWRLTDSCLWFDEIFSVHAVEHSWGGMLSFVAQDLIHPPLFYLLLKVWVGIGAESLLWLRLFPVAFSILALVPFVFLCKELKIATNSMVLAMAFLAVNGSLIKYSQTLRMYSVLLFLSLFSMWLFARYFNRGKNWIWLIVVNILIVYTHYFGWLVVGAEVLAILLFQRIKFGRTALMAVIVAASFAPWVIAILSVDPTSSDLAQNIAWQSRPGLKEMTAFLLDLAEPFYFQASNSQPAAVYFVSVPIFLLCTIALAIFVFNPKSEDEAATSKLLAVFAIFPVAAAFVISWAMPYSVWGTRHLIVITPIVLIVAAHALLSIPERVAKVGILSLIFLLTAYAFYLEVRREPTNFVWCAWEGVASEISESEASGTDPVTIYVFENLSAYHLWFALRNSERHKVGVIRVPEVPDRTETYFLPRGFDEVAAVTVEQIVRDEFWLAFRTVRLGEEFPLLEKFTRSGYSICQPKQTRIDSTNLLRVKVVNDPGACPASQ